MDARMQSLDHVNGETLAAIAICELLESITEVPS
jgi:hypothetical protein